MQQLLLLSALLLFQTVSAQNLDNYEWVGETTTLYTFSHEQKTEFSLPDGKEKLPKAYQKTSLIKFAPPGIECTNRPIDRYFSAAMRRGIEANRYDTKINEQPVDVPTYLQQFSSSIDTIVTFDPENYQESFQVVRRERPLTTNAFYVTQRWFYDGKTLRSMVTAISPFQNTRQGARINGSLHPRPEKRQTDETRLYAESPLAYRTARTIDFARARALKGNTGKFLQQYFIEDAKSGRKALRYNNTGAHCPGADDDTQDILPIFNQVQIDTIITFDPETYEETVEIVRNDPFTLKEVDYFLAVQHWYFDPEQGRVEAVLRAIGPAQAVKNAQGNPLFQRVQYLIVE